MSLSLSASQSFSILVIFDIINILIIPNTRCKSDINPVFITVTSISDYTVAVFCMIHLY